MNETKIKGWVARDKSGTVYLFNHEPHRTDGIFYPGVGDGCYLLDSDVFPELTWKDGAIEVEVTIRQTI